MAVVASIWVWGRRDGEEEICKAGIRGEAAVQSLCRTPHRSRFCHIAGENYKIIIREEAVVLSMCWTANRNHLCLITPESYKILVREEAIIVALCWAAHRCPLFHIMLGDPKFNFKSTCQYKSISIHWSI